jgi:hypothetical protein
VVGAMRSRPSHNLSRARDTQTKRHPTGPRPVTGERSPRGRRSLLVTRVTRSSFRVAHAYRRPTARAAHRTSGPIFCTGGTSAACRVRKPDTRYARRLDRAKASPGRVLAPRGSRRHRQDAPRNASSLMAPEPSADCDQPRDQSPPSRTEATPFSRWRRDDGRLGSPDCQLRVDASVSRVRSRLSSWISCRHRPTSRASYCNGAKAGATLPRTVVASCVLYGQQAAGDAGRAPPAEEAMKQPPLVARSATPHRWRAEP